MKVAILAGGLGTGLSEERVSKPKPMVEIGGRPILWHIIKTFSLYGFNEFVVALGYKGEVIKDYFINYRNLVHSLTIDLSRDNVEVNDGECKEWTLHLLDTGLKTQTGARIKRVAASGGLLRGTWVLSSTWSRKRRGTQTRSSRNTKPMATT